MDYARDRFTNELVHAVDAYPRSHSYQCPCCGGGVFRKGGYLDSAKRAFFAHRSGEGNSECENYHPGTGIIDLGDPQPRPLGLYVFVPQPADVTPFWHLQLLIPECVDDTTASGHVFVDNATHGVVSLPVSVIGAGGSRVSVRAQDEPYRVRLSGIINQSYLRQLSAYTPGLLPTKLNAFRFSDRGGRRLERKAPLLWGHGYYVVWHKMMQVIWPSGLWRRHFRDNGDWHCSEVELPDEESATIVQWVRQYLDKDVEVAPLDISIVAPVPLYESPNGDVVIPAAQDITIGITARPGAAPPERLCVRRGDGCVDDLVLYGTCPMIISLGRGEPGMLEVALPGHHSEPLHLHVKQAASPVEVAGARLVFRVQDSTTETAWPVYCRRVESMLSGVRTNTTHLSAIHLPLRVQPIPSTTGPDTYTSLQNIPTNPFRHPLSTDANIVQSHEDRMHVWQDHIECVRQLIVTLCTRTGPAYELDFGNYGSVHIDIASEVQNGRKTITLSPALRRQLQWVLSLGLSTRQGPAQAPDDGLRPLRQIQGDIYARLIAIDRDLVQRLLERPQWPVAAEVHLRTLARAIRAVIADDNAKVEQRGDQ